MFPKSFKLIQLSRVSLLRFSTTPLLSKKIALRRSNKFAEVKRTNVEDESHSDRIDENFDEKLEADYERLVKRSFRVSEMGHQVFVIQPYIKWGEGKKRITTPKLQLEEAVALISTLPKWVVVDSKTIALQSFNKTTLFGKGNLNNIQCMIKDNKEITAVFISVELLKLVQQKVLEDLFQVPVYDRYNIVMQIFKAHAVTKEAKLQVQLAEIPYLWSRMSVAKGGDGMLRGGTASFSEIQEQILKTKESKIKHSLLKLKEHREILRKKRRKLDFPVIAVVGYTNAGKTSLIKSLTHAQKLQPRNQLFATLDITMHSGLLPSNLEVLYVDTIGFISDIPTNLIQSFVATLEDAMFADLILHVIDVSHPDLAAQVEEVNRTLKSLNLKQSTLDNLILVGNKIDSVDQTFCEEIKNKFGENIIFVSASKEIGTDVLREEVETSVLKVTNRTKMIIRVPSGGDEYRWLYKESTVVEVHADPENSQFSFMAVIITKTKLDQFRHYFINQESNSD